MPPHNRPEPLTDAIAACKGLLPELSVHADSTDEVVLRLLMQHVEAVTSCLSRYIGSQYPELPGRIVGVVSLYVGDIRETGDLDQPVVLVPDREAFNAFLQTIDAMAMLNGDIVDGVPMIGSDANPQPVTDGNTDTLAAFARLIALLTHGAAQVTAASDVDPDL